MIILTSPNGVFLVDEKTDQIKLKLKGNFFGISQKFYTGEIYIAERLERETILHVFKNINRLGKSFKIPSVSDVHQIACNQSYWSNKIFLTDTSRNRIVYFDTKTNKTEIGTIDEKTEEDINHINAIHYNHCNLYIGLNNRGERESQVISLSSCGFTEDEIITLREVHHTHDLTPYRGDILISASHQGFVYSLNKRAPLFFTDGNWTRGITISPEGIWVGYSAVSPRSSRQDSSLNNSINLFSHDTFKLLKSIKVPDVGQVNDILYIQGVDNV